MRRNPSMLELLIILAIYSVLILLFVPLERIGKMQTSVRAKWQKVIDKTTDQDKK